MNFCSLAIAIWLMLFTPPSVSAQHDHSKGREPTAKPAPAKTTAKPALKPAEGASVKIVAPKKDQVIKATKLPWNLSSPKASAATTRMPMWTVN